MTKNVNIYLADDLHHKGTRLLKNKFNVIDLKGLDNKKLVSKINTLAKYTTIKNSALIIRSVRNIDKRIIKKISTDTDIKLICTVSSGFDNIDVDICKSSGIDVMNVAGANSISAAEFTLAVILAISKNIINADHDMKHGIYDYSKYNNYELYGKTIGIIGVGRIGSKVAKLALAFGMNVLGNDISPVVKKKYPSIKFVSLKKLITSSNIVTIHTPLDRSTKYIINKKNMKLFIQNSVLINCSRGGTVDEKSLITVLKNNKLYYAGVDVFESEPGFNKMFTKLNNVLLTPHLAGKTVESKERMSIKTAEKIIEYYTIPGKRNKLIN